MDPRLYTANGQTGSSTGSPSSAQVVRNSAEAARRVMVSADMQRMAPLTPIDAAQTLVAPTAAIKARNWLDKFFRTRGIISADYCVEY